MRGILTLTSFAQDDGEKKFGFSFNFNNNSQFNYYPRHTEGAAFRDRKYPLLKTSNYPNTSSRA